MDICTAAHYMKSGYRIRRISWPQGSFMKAGVIGELEQYHMMDYYKIEHGAIIRHTHLSNLGFLELEDLLADDWELITTGIRKHFGRHGMEYDDDIDWDNYVPSKGGWDFDDEEE